MPAVWFGGQTIILRATFYPEIKQKGQIHMRVGQDLHTKFLKKKRKGGEGGGLFMLWRGTRFILIRGKDSTTRQFMWSKGEKVEEN